MKEENGKQHNGQNMLKEPGQFPAQDIPNDDEQLTMRDLTVGYDRIPLIKISIWVSGQGKSSH